MRGCGLGAVAGGLELEDVLVIGSDKWKKPIGHVGNLSVARAWRVVPLPDQPIQQFPAQVPFALFTIANAAHAFVMETEHSSHPPPSFSMEQCWVGPYWLRSGRAT